MIRLVTYADERMTRARELCVSSSLKYGVEQVSNAGPEDWDFNRNGRDTFEWLNKETLKQERGCGYWLWKPWVIATVMQGSDDGDILIYADAGVEFIAPVQEIISRMDQDIFFFTNGFPNVEWCKGDILKGILGYEYKAADTNAREFKQVQASVIFFKVNQKTRDFVKEWLLYCQMPGWIDDSPSKVPNYPTFAENRHDQAVLSCLQQKHGYKLHFWPTNYSFHLPRPEGDDYPTLFNHHRKRNEEW